MEETEDTKIQEPPPPAERQQEHANNAADELRRATTLLERAEYIAIVLPHAADLDVLCAAEAIAQTLEDTGKYIGFVAPPYGNSIAPVPQMLSHIQRSPQMLKEFIISIDTNGSPIGELRYEKREGVLEIMLSPKSSPIQENTVSFSEGRTQCDALIAIGVKSRDSSEFQVAAEAGIPDGCPVINMDTSKENTRYGDANVVDPAAATMSELAYVFAQDVLRRAVAPEVATVLLAGITHQTRRFSANTSADTFRTVSELIEKGADLGKTYDVGAPKFSLERLQLFGRAAVRSKTDHSRNILWSFLTAEDFAKTRATPEDIPLAAAHLAEEAPGTSGIVLLWQEAERAPIRGVVSALDMITRALVASGEATLNSTTAKLNRTYTSFQDAETNIAALLDTVR